MVGSRPVSSCTPSARRWDRGVRPQGHTKEPFCLIWKWIEFYYIHKTVTWGGKAPCFNRSASSPGVFQSRGPLREIAWNTEYFTSEQYPGCILRTAEATRGSKTRTACLDGGWVKPSCPLPPSLRWCSRSFCHSFM